MSTTHHRADSNSQPAEHHEQGQWLGGVREGYADLSEVQLHYVEAGDGPLVVLLHGFPELWYGWRLQIKALAAAGFRVVAPDMRGYNLSSRPKGVDNYDTEKLAGLRPEARSSAKACARVSVLAFSSPAAAVNREVATNVANCPAKRYNAPRQSVISRTKGITPMNTYVTISRLRSRHSTPFENRRIIRTTSNAITTTLRKLTHPPSDPPNDR